MSCPVCEEDRHAMDDDVRVTENAAARALVAGRAIHRCDACGSRFVWPMPSDEELDAFYAGYRSAGGASDEVAKGRFGIDLDLRFCSRGLSALSFVSPRWTDRLERGATVVELGPGPAELLRLLPLFFPAAHRVAVEPDRTVAPLLRRHGIEVVESRFESLPATAITGADFLVLMMVLEHTREPGVVLDRCRDALADDGELFLRVPNYDEDGFARRSGDDGHLLFLGRPQLERLFHDHGFELVTMVRSGPTWQGAVPVGPAVLGRQPTRLEAVRRRAWDRARRALSPSVGRHWYEDFVSHPAGNAVQAVFRKR